MFLHHFYIADANISLYKHVLLVRDVLRRGIQIQIALMEEK